MSQENPDHSDNAPALEIDQQQARRQMEYLRYKSGDKVYLRFFYHSDDQRKNDDLGRKLDRLRWKEVQDYQQEGRGVYVVVNGSGGGHEDKDIKECVAIFCEWDDRAVEDQLLIWQTVGFCEPTFTIYSGDKSAQPYWVFDKPISVSQWRFLQCLLIEVMGADPANKNPSRVFRLAGGWHVKPGREPRRTEIVQDSGIKYSFEQLRDHLLELKTKVIPATDPLQPPLQEITEPAAPDIVELIGKYIPLRKSASVWIGDCPFCQSREQFIVKPKHQGFECLSCKAGGDADNYHNTAADFLEKYQRSFSASSHRTRYEDVQVPVPSPVPLFVCLSKESRTLIDSGVGSGGRNTNGAKLARDLIGTAEHLQSIGQRFDGDPRRLLDEYASRCTPPLQALEVDSIWKSAEKDRPGPSCTADGVQACIRGWYWNHHVKPNQTARGGRSGSSGSGGGRSSSGSGSNGSGGGSNNLPKECNPYTLVKELMSSGLTPAQLSGELVQLAATTGYQLGGLERLQKEIEAELSKEAVRSEDSKEFVKLVDYRQQDLDLYRIFPEPLAKMLLTKADSDRIDPAFPYLYLLPTVACQLGGHIALLGKEGETNRDNWLEWPLLWTMAVAPPSSGKSQTQRTIMGPIKRVQDRTRASYKKSLKYLEELDKQWQKLSDDEQAQLKDSDRNPNIYREQMPSAPRLYLIEGGSPEGAFKRMGEQGANNGVVLVLDELSRLLALDQYKSNGGDTRQLLLQAWNGPLSLELHRVEDSDSILLNSVCLNLTGGIQPGKVRKLMADPNDGDGLISRILIGTTKTPENFDKWSNTKVAVDSALSGLYEHLRQLHYDLRTRAGLPECDENGQQPTVVLRFSRDAEELWHSWWEELRCGMKRTEHENIALYGYLGKMLSQTLRLALEFHAIELYYEHKANPLEVTRQTLERVIYAAKWHIGQFRLLQAGTDNASLPGDLAKIHAFALRRGKEVSAEQVQNSVFKRTERKPTLATIRQWFATMAQAGACALVGAGRDLKMKALALANQVATAVGIPTTSDNYSDNTKKAESLQQQVTEELGTNNSDNSDNWANASSTASIDDSHLVTSNVEGIDENSSPSSRNCRNDSEGVPSNQSPEPVLDDKALSETQSEDVFDSDNPNDDPPGGSPNDDPPGGSPDDDPPGGSPNDDPPGGSPVAPAYSPQGDSDGGFEATDESAVPVNTGATEPSGNNGGGEQLTALEMADWQNRMNACQSFDDAIEFHTALDSLAPLQRQQFESSVSQERWAWLWNLPVKEESLVQEEEQESVSESESVPESVPDKEPVSVSEPTLEELKALLLACESLVQLQELTRKHKKTIAKVYNSMSELEQVHVDALAALAVPYRVFKYKGNEITQGSERLIKGTLVYLDPQVKVRSTAISAPVWAIDGVASGWNSPVHVSLSLLHEVVKAVLPENEDGGQQMGLI